MFQAFLKIQIAIRIHHSWQACLEKGKPTTHIIGAIDHGQFTCMTTEQIGGPGGAGFRFDWDGLVPKK